MPLRPLLAVCVVSLAVRLVAWWLVTASDVPLLFDEQGYLARGLAWRELLLRGLQFQRPGAHALDGIYGLGHWPPLHPLALGLGTLIGGPTAAAARLVVALLSAVTTLVVCRLGAALFGRKVAIATGWLHALYPGFLAFSHYLWSETTYLLLLSSGLLATVGVTGARGRRERHVKAAAAGIFMGASCLTHASGLAYLLFTPAWLAVELRRTRVPVMAAGSLALVAALVVMPWLMVLDAREGRPVLMSTLGGYNLALGNNPWVPPGFGSSWGHEISKARLHGALAERSRSSGRAATAFGFAIAAEEIARRPVAFVMRSVRRVHELWAVDFFPMRHVFNVVYPPLPPWLAAAAPLGEVVAQLALLTLVVIGLASMDASARRLLIGLAIAGTVIPGVSVGMPRLLVPVLGLLLPAAGLGLQASVRRWCSPRTMAVALVAAGLVVLTTLPRAVAFFILPSSYYAGIVRPFGRVLGVEPAFTDRFSIVASATLGDIEVHITSAGASFFDGARVRPWRPVGGGSTLVLDMVSNGDEALAFAVTGPGWAEPCRFEPVTIQTWRRPLACRGQPVSVRWEGGGPFPVRSDDLQPRGTGG